MRRAHAFGAPALLVLVLALAAFAGTASAQDLALAQSKPLAGGGQSWSVPIQTLVVLTALTFLPSVVLLMTGFTRIVIVLSLLRQALGTQASPPNPVIIGLAIFLTLVVMAPTLERVHDEAYLPLSENRITFQEAAARAEGPMKAFMLRQTREADLALFSRLARAEPKDGGTVKPADLPLRVVVPAFVTSELKTAFQIGFVIFIPFLIIDLVVASVLMSMGMMMLSPMLVSLPFKLILFVLADGWTLLAGSLVASFGGPP
jgi:flagellar biosynthetic protein FliP